MDETEKHEARLLDLKYALYDGDHLKGLLRLAAMKDHPKLSLEERLARRKNDQKGL